ncbi:M48 family metallopeptidase [Metabacillus sp. B2-18]|uniref:M48 family metallopeptidase n=1 Tax=Metabacillus sp. B2-18 TaxID=2897333 RepID=UPI001E61530C|nr:M48 family metallopeptidase [Metabacillus sp. B2-18]UGB30527.1 M48 family metallopeptidase [Metabacillus sp. B2-18]
MENNKNLVHKHEETLFIICVIVSVFMALYLLLSIIGVFIVLAIGLISLFSHALSMAHIQLNGVRLRENQFPELHNKVITLCQKMNLDKVPEVYVIESGGLLNAFATKVLALFGKNMVVLYSDFIDIAEDSDDFDIDYVIAHELAHIKRNHIAKSILLSLSMWIPFLGTSYSRMAEYTCDRMAAHYTEKPENAINGLLVLAAGRRLYNKVNIQEYLTQYNEKRGIFAILTELLSTHPPIPKRIHEIELFTYGEPSVQLKSRTKRIVLLMFVIFVVIPTIFIGFGVGTAVVLSQFTSKLDEFFTEIEYGAEYTPLMQAVIDADQAKVEDLLLSGEDPNEVNEYEESVLMIAVTNDQADFIPLLVEYGADPNWQDSWGWTALISAVYEEDIDTIKKLLEAGADPALTDSEGISAVDHAYDIGNDEIIELLN